MNIEETRKQLLEDVAELRAFFDKFSGRANKNYVEHIEAVNRLWHMIQSREGKYKSDATAQSWTRIMHEHYLQAKAIWELFNDDPPVGMKYTPPKTTYVGKCS